MTLNDFLLYATVLAAALVPSGLAAELALSQRITSAPIAWIVRAATSDAGALLLLVIIGIIGQLVYHVPLAITTVQIIAVSILTLLVPITALAGDRPKDVSSSAPIRWLSFGLLSAALAYVNFLFFFERRGISPTHLDSNSTLYFHAATLSFTTIVLCRLVSLLFIRAEHRKRFFTRYLGDNKGLLVALASSMFLIVLCIYYPPLRHYFDTQPLSITDWLTALLATAMFSILHLLQRHTRQHTRKAIIDLHRQVHAQP
jgi:magnesium-transporting ATPase (P-type)